MHEISALIGIVASITVGVISPGPSFIMVARTAIAASRDEGLAAAVGMGLAGTVLSIAALAGLNSLLLAMPSLYLVLKVAGGLYLVYIGVRVWSGAKTPLAMVAPAQLAGGTRRRSLLLGFTTNVSNPKASIIYASVFAAFLPPAPSLAFNVAVVMLVTAVEVGWYSIVAMTLSTDRPRSAYLRYKATVDRVAGGVMMALGLKLISSAQKA
ncbi:MAG: LysE family transporter [Betaproteobacteria bacterium]|nr:LysE family transporter [Betaproteobacteria bacterium]